MLLSAKKLITALFLFLTLFVVIAAYRPIMNKNVSTGAAIKSKTRYRAGRS